MAPFKDSVLSLIVFLITITSAVDCSSDEVWSMYYVKPSEGTECSPHLHPCYTLQYYTNNSNFSSNSTFLFLKGLHILHGIAEIRNITNLALVGVGLEDLSWKARKPQVSMRQGHLLLTITRQLWGTICKNIQYLSKITDI